MTTDTLLTIALALGAFLSPVVVAVLTSNDGRRKLISESRRDWLNHSKKLIDAYLESLNSYASSEATKTELKILSTISRNKNQLLMQYKPYLLDDNLISREESGLVENRFNQFKDWVAEVDKEGLSNDGLEKILVNYLHKTELILEEAYKNEEIPIDEIKYISESLPIIYSGVQKNEWKKISKSRRGNYNEVVRKNLISLTDRYIDKLEMDLSDDENYSLANLDNVKKLENYNIDIKLSQNETVPEYFYRVFLTLDNHRFVFREYSGKRKHKYLSFDSPEGMISAKKFTQKDGKTFYYELNLSRAAAPTVLKNIINKGELK